MDMRGLLGWFDRRREMKRAGRSAREEYERLKRDWRKRMRKRFVLLGALFAAITILVWVLAAIWPKLEFTSGLVSGALMAIFIALRESPPGWVDQWLTGAQGEQWTDEQLRRLERRGWIILRDLQRTGYNVDHVAIGPAGVFVIDSKNLDGQVTCSGDELRLRRPGAPVDSRPAYSSTEAARHVRGQAAELNEQLRSRAGRSLWVTGVVALWADLEPASSSGNRMHFVRGDSLTDWLQAQPRRLDPEQVQAIGIALTPARRRKAG
jgi:hypothetical protein